MAYINWKDEYSVGVNELDQQHLKLVNIINKLHEAMLQGQGVKIMKDIFIDLQDYIQEHFKKEEQLMFEYAYPDYENHKYIHQGFIKKVRDLKYKFDNGERTISAEVVEFLKDWLLNHICGTDQEYTAHFKKSGLK